LSNLSEQNSGKSSVGGKNSNIDRNINKNKIESGLGLAKKAGAIISGAELVMESVRKKKAVHVFICSDASGGTVKKLRDKAEFYQVPVTKLDLTMSELAHCVGRVSPTAAVSLTNKNFLRLFNLPDIPDITDKTNKTDITNLIGLTEKTTEVHL